MTVRLTILCAELLAAVNFAERTAVAESTDRRIAEEFADAYISRFLTVVQAESHVAAAQSSSFHRDETFEGLLQKTAIDSQSKSELEDLIAGNVLPLGENFRRVQRSIEQSIHSTRNQWLDLRTRRNLATGDLRRATVSGHAAQHFASLLALDNRFFWLSALIAVSGIMVVAWHERRHEYRRLLKGARARSLGLALIIQVFLASLLVLVLAVFLAGDRIYEALVLASGEESSSSLGQLQAEIDSLPPPVTERPPFGDASAESPIAQAWQSIEGPLLASIVASQVEARLAAAMRSDAVELARLDQELVTSQEQLESFTSQRRWTSAGLGGMLTAGTLVAAAVLWRGIRRRRRTAADTCPLCMGTNTLHPDESTQHQPANLRMLRCDNVIADDPYEECDYTFMPSYREMFKLCFPTLGINLSGKTHWLAMLYRELCSRDSVAQAKFSKVRSKTSEEFDRIVDELIASRIGPSRTQTASLPQPLVFTLRDRDRMGISTVLLNLFDYSGEIYQGRSLEHPHRRRALHADGYFLFIDPTEPKEAQVRELENFREDLQLVRGLRPGQSVRTPIALCVSKIDLLGQQPYADPGGRGVIGQFYRDLAEVDASGERLDLGVIHGRSELVRGIRHQIWPGWDIEDKVRELFGGRFMYFPLTPVGLADLGVSDFRDKSSIEAFAIFEPLLWVLHMNGYRVFA